MSMVFKQILLVGAVVLALTGCNGSSGDAPESGAVVASGRVEGGLRVLTFDASAKDQHFLIYRGDYVRAELSTGESFTLDIPSLELQRTFPAGGDEKPYFKVPDAGTFPFSIGDAGGTIEAVEYAAASYREVSAKEASALIANLDPVILDVRSDREFAGGHLENAVLIPVQVLRNRIDELAVHKQETILVYCKSGNRSTVAAKMLNDAGFEKVINMRRGIRDWQGEGLPLAK